ncbi:dCMP deaminase family protein [Ectothiorhodospira shaposhnikovii]|uniref:dCMP deaminase family protein n=1 Tax=Ectothiorhodospira shaposhnikovii TaxID=1054 RepID=UPI001EE89BD3|nr:dCMP deaminase family protein [Ectothiorhodospira shaposhnikovii]MCG5512832.1 dCMP deaminase family protein [Ectothiorhodospira shaposhnikovii]
MSAAEQELVSEIGWDDYFLSLAMVASRKSKDPSTKVGAVIVSPSREHVSSGFNGLPRGVKDVNMPREERIRRTIHAEENAILFARRDLAGHTIYITAPPCSSCASKIAQVGISRVCFMEPTEDFIQRWRQDIEWALDTFRQANIEVSVFRMTA